MFVRVSAVRNARLFAPKRPVTPLGLESDQDCQPGQTATTHFQLIDFPGMGHAVPLATGGHSHYAGSRVRTVTVTDWNHADELHVRRGGADLVLTPASPSGQIPVDNHWFGTTRWLARRVADGEAHGYPELDLGLECPATPPAPTVDQPVGYGLSLAQLQLALQQATGGVGLGAWLAAATDTNLPVYAVRVAPKLDPLPGGPTHSLRLVLRGSYALVGLPLTATGPDSWSLDVTEGPLLLHGTVTRQAGTLTLALESGSYGYDGLPLTLQPATLTIDALGGN